MSDQIPSPEQSAEQTEREREAQRGRDGKIAEWVIGGIMAVIILWAMISQASQPPGQYGPDDGCVTQVPGDC